jgi:hypothetical protein
MSTRFLGGIISATPPTVSTSSAPGVWSLEQALQYIKAGNWPVVIASDPYFKYITMLLHGDGTNGAQNNTFLDSSTNNFTITRNGNTTQGTFSPYGSNWSNYFTNNLLNCGNASLIAGTNTFTIEFWIYLNSINSVSGGDQTFIDTRTSNGADSTAWLVGVVNTSNLKWFTGSSDTNLGGTLPYSQWVHVAYTRNASNVITAYINGVATGTTTTDSRNLTNTNFWIGGNVGNGYPLDGYFSNVRWVVGSVLYTSNFTPSTTPLTAVTNTKLLTCQSNRFVDNSGNNISISTTNSPSVQRFSPFSPSAAYSTSVIGGSGYFDGSGDYLSVANNAAFGFTGDYSVSGWAYIPSNSGLQILVDFRAAGNSNGAPVCYINSGQFSAEGGSSAGITGGTFNSNSWNYWEMSRVGTTFRIFLNGVQVASTTDTTSNANCKLNIATNRDVGQSLTGYIADVQVLKGVGNTTSTIPTAPRTNTANTSLLTNFTNGGIFDNAMMNNLETVGNAQISTAQSKFGGSSMYFNGSSYLSTNSATTNLYAFGTGDFTVEFWLYMNSIAGITTIYESRPSGAEGQYVLLYSNSGAITLYVNGGNVISSSTVSINTWYHVALCRSSGSTKLFINGTQSGSTYSDANNYINATNRPFIGANNTGSYFLNGYIDDLRITKGYARYTSTFTPPAAAFPNQ